MDYPKPIFSATAKSLLARSSTLAAAYIRTLKTHASRERLTAFAKARCEQIKAERNRVVRVGLGISLLVTAGAIYGPDLLYISSADAIINARTAVLTAAIEGDVTKGPPREGTVVYRGERLLSIVNPTVDLSRLDTLMAERERTLAKLASLKTLSSTLEGQLATTRNQAESYREATVRRLEIMLKERQSAVAAARADATAAALDYQRVHEIEDTGALSRSDIEKSRQEAERTKAELERAESTVHRTATELQAARDGIYVYQDRNNVTYSEQHGEELSLRLAELQAQSAEAEAQSKDLKHQIDREADRYSRLSRADVSSPLDGIIWRPLAVAGMHVPRDSELLTVMDCAELYVTAAFADRKFESIHRGDQASIKVDGSGKVLTGVVTDVRAIDSSKPNGTFAMPFPVSAGHHITVVLRVVGDVMPDDRSTFCGIGRKAEVRFDGGSSAGSIADATFSTPRASLISAQ